MKGDKDLPEDENQDDIIVEDEAIIQDEATEHSLYRPVKDNDGTIKHQLSGMYQGWFLDYASYVKIGRAHV